MGEEEQIKLYLSNYQVKKLESGKRRCQPVRLEITSKNLEKFKDGECTLFKFNGGNEAAMKLQSIKTTGKANRIEVTPSQIQTGGFIPIPLIIAGIGALASTLGAVGNTVINHNKAKNEIKELKDHYTKIEKAYEKKGGEPPLPLHNLGSVDVDKAKKLSEDRKAEPQRGSGWADCRKKVEYHHIENLNQLCDRLRYIKAQEGAGNTSGFESEKKSIGVYLSNTLEKCEKTDVLLGVSLLLDGFGKNQSGEGLINTIINKLPIEAHLPGYNYLGPGTYLDVKYPTNVLGINRLDEAAKDHDIAYNRDRTVEGRKEADAILRERAWEIFKNPSTPSGEKAAAWLTTTAMKAKRAIGCGMELSGEGVYYYSEKLDKKYQNGGSLLPSTKLKRW